MNTIEDPKPSQLLRQGCEGVHQIIGHLVWVGDLWAGAPVGYCATGMMLRGAGLTDTEILEIEDNSKGMTILQTELVSQALENRGVSPAYLARQVPFPDSSPMTWDWLRVVTGLNDSFWTVDRLIAFLEEHGL